MSDISVLLEYLKEEYDKSISQDNHPDYTNRFQKWATAVEQLQEDLAKARSFHARAVAKVEAYERILDKVGPQQPYILVAWKDDTGHTFNSVTLYDPTSEKFLDWDGSLGKYIARGESEDKVDQTYFPCDCNKCSKEFTNTAELAAHVCLGDKVEKPSHDIEMELIAKSIPIANRVANRVKSENSEAGE